MIIEVLVKVELVQLHCFFQEGQGNCFCQLTWVFGLLRGIEFPVALVSLEDVPLFMNAGVGASVVQPWREKLDRNVVPFLNLTRTHRRRLCCEKKRCIKGAKYEVDHNHDFSGVFNCERNLQEIAFDGQPSAKLI